MQRNVGVADRWITVVIGLILIGAALAGHIGVWAWLGVVPLVAAAIGYCPVYGLLNLRGCRVTDILPTVRYPVVERPVRLAPILAATRR